MKPFIPKNKENNEKNNGNSNNKSENEKIINNINPINPILIPAQFFINPLSKTPKNVFNKYQKHKNCKPFVERTGDWICKSCQNLNFAFRNKCNRCGLQKSEENYVIKKNEEKSDEKENIENEQKSMKKFSESDSIKNNDIEDFNDKKEQKNISD